MKDIVTKYEKLIEGIKGKITPSAGVMTVEKQSVLNSVNSVDYETFIKSRHSYRYFSQEPVAQDKLKKAFSIAAFAPTACNRQPQKLYVYTGEKKDTLLRMQGGCLGFYKEINIAILVTVDQRMYFDSEFHQSYVCGGMYSMCLLHALYFVGLGTIPLTMGGFQGKRRRELIEKFNIPEHENPVMIICCGNLNDESRVNLSERKNFETYTFGL